MQNVPQSVINRLRSQASDSHPDADLLTAFAEQTLAESERDHVMEHLARCGDCREVVALAMPAFEEVVGVNPTRVTHSNWFTWPVFRWSFVAAGILAVASIGVVQFRHSHEKTMVATSLQSTESLQQAQRAQAAAPESSTRTAVNLKKETSAQNPSPADQSVTTANAVFQQPRPMRVAPPMLGGTVHGAVSSGSGAGPSFKAAPVSSQNNFSSATPSAEDSATVGKAKPASPQAFPVMPSPLLHTDPSLMRNLPRWTIGNSGALQRSLDGGKTWQDVIIAIDQSDDVKLARVARPAPGVSSTVEVSAAAPVAQTETDSQNSADASPAQSQANYNGSARAKSALKTTSNSAVESKNAPASSANPVFRALSVSSNAAEVWAGGSGATLYHTIDAGNRWVRVLPADSGAVLTGDVLSIQFVDAVQGTVRTSTAESWITADDGQTWHKQQ
ncbi:MAG: YCF48-related protein [Candidatus Sulfotelmatobacter sp.]